MKTYQGQRPADDVLGDCRVTVIAHGRSYPLSHVQFHSTGFEWGYGGSGPADTALSILADYFDEQPSRAVLMHGDCQCWRYHQAFKWAFIAPAAHTGFAITTEQIATWLATQEG